MEAPARCRTTRLAKMLSGAAGRVGTVRGSRARRILRAIGRGQLTDLECAECRTRSGRPLRAPAHGPALGLSDQEAPHQAHQLRARGKYEVAMGPGQVSDPYSLELALDLAD